MEIFQYKVLFLFVILVIGTVAGLIPTRFTLTEKGKRQLVLGNAFSGGVFFGAGLLHMLPDARENFHAYFGGIDYPVTALICAAGFFLILLIEKVLLRGSEDVGALSGHNALYPFILCLVLSVHSIIAGTSLGLESGFSASLAIFFAIIAHKGAAAFALGVSLRDNGFTLGRHSAIVVFFSFMTPLGILLGTLFLVVLTSRMSMIFEAVFDALAAGTFLYVAVLDIIDEVFRNPGDRWMKLLMITFGFALMAIVAIWV